MHPLNVNVTNVKTCGEMILEKMNGNSPLIYSFKKVMQAVQIPATAKIISKSLTIVIDSELLFQRLVTEALKKTCIVFSDSN